MVHGGEVYELLCQNTGDEGSELALAWKFQAGPSGAASSVLALPPHRCSWHFPPWGNGEGEKGAGVVSSNSLCCSSASPPLPHPAHGTLGFVQSKLK